MYKIMITVRNRLAMTKKCLRAIEYHSKLPHQIYIYDNLTNYKLKEHFDFYHDLMSRGKISQITFNTATSTFRAFSKAAACNEFGALHEQDPNKDNIMFLVFLDNDIIVTPGWDKTLRAAWKDIRKNKHNNVKVIGQRPGGIKNGQKLPHKIAGVDAVIGKLGGSALWCVKNNFFRDVGYLDLRQLVNKSKAHDQNYWRKLAQSTNGQRYILGLSKKLGIHCGRVCGSVCNTLTRRANNGDISFKNQDERIDNMNFETFYKNICNRKELHNDW